MTSEKCLKFVYRHQPWVHYASLWRHPPILPSIYNKYHLYPYLSHSDWRFWHSDISTVLTLFIAYNKDDERFFLTKSRRFQLVIRLVWGTLFSEYPQPSMRLPFVQSIRWSLIPSILTSFIYDRLLANVCSGSGVWMYQFYYPNTNTNKNFLINSSCNLF